MSLADLWKIVSATAGFYHFTLLPRAYVRVCVCVSTPGQRVFHRYSFHCFSTTFFSHMQGSGAGLQSST